MLTFQKKYYLFKELRILFEVEQSEFPVFKPTDPEICGEPSIEPAPIDVEQSIVTIKGPVEEDDEIQKVLRVLPENGAISELRFDGRYVKIAINDPRTGEAVEISIPAASGTRDEEGRFDYSRERWDKENKGPLPPGKWSFNPSQIQEIGLTDKVAENLNQIDLVRKIAKLAFNKDKIGSWPGGTASWGNSRVDLTPMDDKAKASKRKGLMIHGGAFPASAGCIDMVHNNNLFFAIIEKYTSSSDNNSTLLALNVDYTGLEGQRIAYENPDIKYTVAPDMYAKKQAKIARADLTDSVTAKVN